MWFASCSLKRKAGVDWGTISLRKRKKMQYKYNTNLKIIQALSFNVSTCVYFNIYLKCIVVPPILSNLSKILYFFFNLSVFSYQTLMNTEGRQSNLTLYTSPLCGAIMWVRRRRRGNGLSISCDHGFTIKGESCLSSQLQR